MRIALVPHVPHDRVVRRSKHTVQRHGQFHHAQIRGEVSAVGRHGVDHRLSQLFTQCDLLFFIQFFDVGRRVDLFEIDHDLTFLLTLI